MSVYTSSVPPVGRGERKPGQKMITFWVPEAERDAFMAATKENGETATDVLRKAASNYVKRAERKRAAG